MVFGEIEATAVSNPWVQLGIGGAAVAVMFLLGKQLISEVFKSKNKNGNGYNSNGHSYGLTSEQIRDVVHSQLETTLAPVLSKITNLLEDIATTQDKMVDTENRQTELLVRMQTQIESIQNTNAARSHSAGQMG